MVKNKVKINENCERIEYLISRYFIKKNRSEDGWEVLYQDPSDLRFWELTYPNSDWHGGGPPALIHLSVEAAKKKYDFETIDDNPWFRA